MDKRDERIERRIEELLPYLNEEEKVTFLSFVQQLAAQRAPSPSGLHPKT